MSDEAKNKKKKVLVPIFNRAHYGRLRSVLRAIQTHPELELQIMLGTHAAYRSFLTNLRHSRPHSWWKALPWYVRARLHHFLSFVSPDVFQKTDFLHRHIRQDGFTIHSRVPIFLDGGDSATMAKSVALSIPFMVDEFRRLRPDVVFINADRFEMMAVALAASYLNIPIAHNEGGDISGTLDESVRHSITKLSHLHFTATPSSRNRVIQMGEQPERVFVVGSPAIDTIKDLDDSLLSLGHIKLDQPYLVVLIHPVATESNSKNEAMAKTIISTLETLRMPTILLGSNMDAGSSVVGKIFVEWIERARPDFLYFTKTLPPDDFYRVLRRASCALGNSSSFIRESAFFGTPTVLVGSRQQGRERGQNVVEVLPETEQILAAVRTQLKHGRYTSDDLFGDGATGQRIAEILAQSNPAVQKIFFDINYEQ